MAITSIQYPPFQPAVRNITAITNAVQALVTTSLDHQYISGMIVRLYIPWNFGMVQANELSGSIIVSNSTQFLIDIDTSNFDPFAFPPDVELPSGLMIQAQYAQVVPFGEQNDMLAAAVRNVLPYP